MKRKVLSLLLCILLLLPATVFAQTFTEGCFYYEVVDDSITITGYFGREREVTVPTNIAGLPVSTIAGGAFSGNNVDKINLPDTIMTIESGAFGQSQSVVYNSNTNTPITREPQSTQQPSGSGSGSGDSNSGGSSSSGSGSGGSGAVQTSAPTPTAASGANGGQGSTVRPTATPVQSAAPGQTPAPGASGDELPPLPTSVNPTESPKQTDGDTNNGQPEQSSAPGAAAVTQQPDAVVAPAATGIPDAGDIPGQGGDAQPIDDVNELPTAGFEVSELLEDGTVEIVQSATTMPTPTPVPNGEKDEELIVTLDGQSGGMRIGVLVGVIVLVLAALAAAVCIVLLVMRRRRARRNDAD